MTDTPIPPKLSREQRLENLQKACRARRIRAEIKKQLRIGELSIFDVLLIAKKEPCVGRFTTLQILSTLPQVGTVKAWKILESIGVPNRRIGGLGKYQMAKIVDATRYI